MKIISLNTWMGHVREPLLDFFTQHKNTHIFCLQEIYKDARSRTQKEGAELELFERIQESFGETHTGHFRPTIDDYYGIAVFVRKDLHILEEGEIVIYDSLGWKDDGSDRGNHSRNLQYIRLQLGDKTLLVAHVHGLWKLEAGKVDLPERIEQSERIKDFLSKYTDPKVLLGDFNLNPDTKSLAIVEEGMRNLIKEYGVTSTRTHYYEKEGKFADYALVSPEIVVKEFKVLPDVVSDHAALYLEIG